MGRLVVTRLSAASYEGSIASRARITRGVQNDTTNKWLMTRSAHIAAENISALKAVFSNFSTDGGGADFGMGASTTIKASVEYPAGTFTQILFSGSSSGTISNINILFADYVTVSIPIGATFWIRSLVNNSAGIFYNNWQNTFLGEASILSATSLTDQTMSGTITNSNAVSWPPIAILGITSNPSVVIVGDSVAVGAPGGVDTEDSSSSATGYNAKVGLVARSLGNIPFLSIAAGGQTANGWSTNSPARAPLITKGSHIICEMGVNDLAGAGTAASLITNLQAIFALAASFQKKYQCTIIPRSTSSDSFATLVNQTSVNAAERISFNNTVRGIPAWLTGYFETADVLESGRDSGKWVVSPSPPYTPDGVHPHPSGYALVAASGAISTSAITWP